MGHGTEEGPGGDAINTEEPGGDTTDQKDQGLNNHTR